MNPLGLTEALLGAMLHSAKLDHAAGGKSSALEDMKRFTAALRKAVHNTFRYGQGTRDMVGPEGLTTEAFIEKVAWRLGRYVAQYEEDVSEDLKEKILKPSRKLRRNYDVDRDALKELFDSYDQDKNGAIGLDELEEMLVAMSVAPLKDPSKRSSASKDKGPKE